MKKRISSMVILTLIFSVVTAQAFTINSSLEEQVAAYDKLEVNADKALALSKNSQEVKNLVLSPDYTNDRTIYVAAGETYRNTTFDPMFSNDFSLPADAKGKALKAIFSSNYKNDSAVILSSSNSAYISNDKGNNWFSFTPATDEVVSQVSLGPNYTANPLVYFTTPTGLYSQNVSSNMASLVLESSASEVVSNFTYSPTSKDDKYFYVIKGKKVLKTENFASSWLEHDTGNIVRQLVIAESNSDTASGEVLVLSGDKKLEKSEASFSFSEMNLPTEIKHIYGMNYIKNGEQDYIISTDKGIYYTYDNGSTWTKINYSISDYSDISEINAVEEGGKIIVFFIHDNVLYRDPETTGALDQYMTGMNVTSKYELTGTAESKDMVALTGHTFDPGYKVTKATMWADGDLNKQSMNFFMSTDGTNWEPITLEEEHTFVHQGTMLKWKVEMNTTDTAVSPVLRTVLVDFGLEEVPANTGNTCAGFTDVPKDSPNCAALTYVKDNGIFTGYPDGTFKPDQVINRAETVKVMTEGFKLNMLADPSDKLGFSDVILHEWYMPYLATAKAGNIIQGYPDGTFKPEQTVNFVELIKMFFETADVTLPATSGSDAWYQKYLSYAKNNNYLTYTDLTAGMKRSDVATLFYQLSQK